MEPGESPSVGDGATATAPDGDASVTGSTIDAVETGGLKSVESTAVAAPKAEGASGGVDSSVTSGLKEPETEETALAPEPSVGEDSGGNGDAGAASKKEHVSGREAQSSLAAATDTGASIVNPEGQPLTKDVTQGPKQITTDAGATLPASVTKDTEEDTPGPKQITTAAGAVLPASVVKEIQDRATAELLDLPKSKDDGHQLRTETRGGVTSRTEEDDDGNAGLAGREKEGGLSPTPPRRTSNPISRGTPPRRCSRGGNLAIITQSPGNEPDLPRPMSPRSRPRDQPLNLMRLSLSNRETPRGGVFAKIPGLDQHLAVEARKMNEPPRFRPPKLVSGTVRQYDQEEASEAAFRYPECRGAVFRPSFADDGSFDDLPATSPLLSEPPHRLRLERARGYHGGGFYPSTDNNAFFLGEHHMPTGGRDRGSGSTAKEQAKTHFEVVYPTAALVVMHKFPIRDGECKDKTTGGGAQGRREFDSSEDAGGDKEGGDVEMMQRYFDGHTDDVTAVAVHPGGVLVASGQICCLDFSPDGWLLCSVGADCKSTTNIWDWRKGVAIAKVQAGPGPIHAFRFNPYQARGTCGTSYGVPSKKPIPGQALHIDDSCYCLVSIGVRHSKFWLLTRGLEEPSKDEIPPVLANAKWTSSQRVQEEREKDNKGRGNLRWILDGSSARLNGKGKTADFTCLTFIDDSPPLQTWGKNNKFAKDVKRGKGGRGIFLDPWWLFGPGHEVTANKRLWDLGAELVDNIPHSLEAANDLVLSDKAKERVLALEKNMAVKPLHPDVFEELKRQHDRFSYTGPLTGHEGGVSALAFNRETGKVVSAGTNGEVVQWQAFFFDPTVYFDPAVPLSSTRRASATGKPSGSDSHSETSASKTTTHGIAANASLVGLINARRNRQEDKLQKNLRSRDPSEPTLRRIGHEAPRGDGRVGGVDVFEMDYQTTLGREDEGEITLTVAHPSDGSDSAFRPSRVDMFGSCGNVDGFESSSTRRGLEKSANGDSRRGSRDQGGRGDGPGLGISVEGGVESGLRVEFFSTEFREGGGEGHEAAVAGDVHLTGQVHAGTGSTRTSPPLPRGSHCKSLVWSKDGTRLLTGLNTNVLLLLEYPADDRSVAIWNTSSNLPVAWCHNLPSPISCLACSPDLEEVAVGTVNTNEIFFLTVHRARQSPDPTQEEEERGWGDAPGNNAATGIEFRHSKQLLPDSAWAKRRPPGPNARWNTTKPSWDRCKIVTLDGKDTPHAGGSSGGAPSNGGTSGGGASLPHLPHPTPRVSPARSRVSPSRPTTFGAVPGGRGAGFRIDDQSRRGRRRYCDGGGEPPRGMGASCMRYSPSGSHLAIGCKNGSLVIMAVEHDDGRYDDAGEQRGTSRGISLGRGVEQPPEVPEGMGMSDPAYEDFSADTGSEPSPSYRPKRGRRTVYRRIAHLKGHSSRVLHLDWTEDGRFVHTCGQDYHLLHWDILPPSSHRQGDGAARDGGAGRDACNGGGDEEDDEAFAGESRPRIFKRAFLVRNEPWATWSSTIGWPVQGVFPAYSDNTEVNAVDLCKDRELLAAADDAKTVRLLRYPVLRGGARNRSYTAHSSHVMGARFTVGVEPTRLITLGGMDSTVIQWVVEDVPSSR
ncbi:unnamed protein product [Ectocarpus sp. 6 AP-2014]